MKQWKENGRKRERERETAGRGSKTRARAIITWLREEKAIRVFVTPHPCMDYIVFNPIPMCNHIDHQLVYLYR